jgi:hypothetical protein
LNIEKTENGKTVILENQQLFGHQYGAGGANSGKERRKYDFLAENLVTSIVTMASKIAPIMSAVENITKITALAGTGIGVTAALTGVILILASTSMIPMVGIVMLFAATLAAILVGIIAAVNAVIQVFNTERHIS